MKRKKGCAKGVVVEKKRKRKKNGNFLLFSFSDTTSFSLFLSDLRTGRFASLVALFASLVVVSSLKHKESDSS